MKLINERLEFLVETFARGRYSDFCEQTGLQYGTFKNYISGRLSKPSSDSLERIILTFPQINAKWLLTGHGDPFDEPEKKKGPVGGDGEDPLLKELLQMRKKMADIEQAYGKMGQTIAAQGLELDRIKTRARAKKPSAAQTRARAKKDKAAPTKGRGFGRGTMTMSFSGYTSGRAG